jgi:hypothetical protein
MQIVLRRKWIAVQLIVAATLAASPIPVIAQSSLATTLTVDATVVAPLAMTVAHTLDFGKIITSTSRTIAPSDATSGRLEITGQRGSAVSVTLNMPSTLVALGGSGAVLPVTAWKYIVGTSSGSGGAPVSFSATDSDPFTVILGTPADGATTMYIGIGATITAAADQRTTTYNGTGHITAAYSDL